MLLFSKVAVVILSIQSFSQVDGLTCLQCRGVSSPRLCKRVADCGAGEVCTVEEVVNEFEETEYHLGCMSENVCRNSSSTDGSTTCTYCCNNDICNHVGCGGPDYPVNRGPVCYNCVNPYPSGRCHDVEFCAQDHECKVRGDIVFGNMTFTSTCVLKDTCTGSNIFGKRFIDVAGPRCETCCSTDVCNRECKQILQSTTTTTAGPTTSGLPGGGLVFQWVQSVLNFSSEYSNPNWAASQVIGAPDVYPAYGDIGQAWAAASADRINAQFLEVQFAQNVHVTGIDIYETYHAGGVTAVKCLQSGSYVTLWSSNTTQDINTSRIFSPLLAGQCYSNVIRIEIAGVDYWAEIDAVQLRGN
ncbi:uncharacterized protein LOC128221129 [Mya arenaria]|uniref:uncharacterized protein LOC128221129 n=1 Tax=Mya arenaria TaxID=6604 RepID=UPI0022E84863|nr:uncharacterized protein LOC128221129 [Mya arenaria]